MPKRVSNLDFLLEIGCEELPADYLPAALDWDYPNSRGLASAAAAVFSESGIIWKELQVWGAPRRLVLKVSGIEPQVHETLEGPPLSVAFDAEGKPTRAAEAFAQKCGVKVSQLLKKETPRGPRLIQERSIPARRLLADSVAPIIQKIAFPKTMRWDSSGARFARPVRWQLALTGSGTGATFVGRPAEKKGVRVTGVSGYFSALKKAGIELENGCALRRRPDGSAEAAPFQPAKKEALRRKLEAAARKSGGRLPDQTTEEFDWLLNTVTFLAEEPVVGVGSFRPEYLDLPAEVLQTSMAKHLKLFSVYSPDGRKLLPKFLAVLEGNPKKPALVMANMDRIIEARFTDARFFFQEDTKTRLEAKVQELAKVVFHDKLGSMKERVDHMAPLMAKIAGKGIQLPQAQRAALLCKADLVTQMVREFPSLQGVIGGKYAEKDGEPAEVAKAVSEHYQPRAFKDPLPSTPLGAVLSFADRLDTLIGYFGVGLKPTGSADPYGLRRQALGLVRILIEPPAGVSFVGLSIDSLFGEGIQSWGSRLTVRPESLRKELHAFLKERFEWLQRQQGIDAPLIEAVLAAGADDFAAANERLKLLQAWWKQSRSKPEHPLLRAAKVAERAGRIVQSVKGLELPDSVDAAALKDPLERELWRAWDRLAPSLKQQLEQRKFEEAIQSYSTLYPSVHAFFEKVFVMDEDMNVRKNRLALLKQIHQSLAGGFADLSRLPQ